MEKRVQVPVSITNGTLFYLPVNGSNKVEYTGTSIETDDFGQLVIGMTATAPSTYATTKTVTLTVGGVSGTWKVITNAPAFTTITASGATSGNTFATMWGYTFACTITGSYQFDGSISGTAAADSYMYLYNASGSSILTENDDSGPDASSMFTYTCNAGTSYIVKIRDYFNASATAYLTITKL